MIKKAKAGLCLLLSLSLLLVGCSKDSALIAEKVSVAESHVHLSATDGVVRAQYVAKIQNDSDKTVAITDISIDALDDKGTVLLTQRRLSAYRTLLAPGETCYVEANLLVGSEGKAVLEQIAQATIHYTVAEQKEIHAPKLALTAPLMRIEEDAINFVVTIKNESDRDADDLIIAVPILDAEGNLRTILTQNVALLPAGKSAEISIFEVYDNQKKDSADFQHGDAFGYFPADFQPEESGAEELPEEEESEDDPAAESNTSAA